MKTEASGSGKTGITNLRGPEFCIQSDGSFITCEKGSVRIKVYTKAGELESVVATSGDFDPDSEPPDLAVDEKGGIYALDITRKMIRKFERKG